MDQIEKPLSILLIIGAIAYFFMFNSGDGYGTIEKNYTVGYTVNSTDMKSGYNVTGANTCEGYDVNVQKIEIYIENSDTLSVDSLITIPSENMTEELMDGDIVKIEE